MSARLLPQYVAAVTISIGAFGFGTVLAWTANITDGLKNGELNGIKMGNHELGWAASCGTIGAIFVCLIIGLVADWIGRKPTCLIASIPCVIGWLLIIFAQNVFWIYLGRFFTGLAGGVYSIIAPLYSTEVAQIHIRGRLGTMMQLFLVAGAQNCYISGFLFSIRVYNIINLSIPILFVITFIFQPESPFYYIKVGKPEQAAKSFARLRGPDYDFTEEQEMMTEAIESQKYLKDFRVVIRERAAQKSTLICFMLMYFQKLCGINVVIFYGKEIFIQSNTGLNASLSIILMGFTSFMGIVFLVWISEYFGRTTLFMASTMGCALGGLGLAIFFTVKERLQIEEITKLTFFPITCVLVFMFCFNWGLGPLPWVACMEIFSPELKAKLGAPAASFNWLFAFLVSKFYYPVAEVIGIDGAFYFFAANSLFAFFFVLLIMPESRHKTYQEIYPKLQKFWNF